MITKNIKQFCTNYEQIENYEAAINDKNETWHCHHRLEIRDDYINTREELIMMNLYDNRPPEELIFLKPSDHIKLHQNNEKKRELIRKNLLRYHHGENWTDEDQEKFERERNRRQCLTHRNKHREEYTDYQREYQRKYREEHKFHYRTYSVEPPTP